MCPERATLPQACLIVTRGRPFVQVRAAVVEPLYARGAHAAPPVVDESAEMRPTCPRQRGKDARFEDGCFVGRAFTCHWDGERYFNSGGRCSAGRMQHQGQREHARRAHLSRSRPEILQRHADQRIAR